MSDRHELSEVAPVHTDKLQVGGLSAAAARQRLSRPLEEVKTLYGLPFSKRARFIYLENQFGTQA